VYRSIEKNLLNWKNSKNKKPLIIRGARQVGKTYIITNFLSKFYKNTININFEKNPNLRVCFENSLDPKEIINKIEVFLNIEIDIKNDLIFFDEIQSCPKAIQSLRYFYEDLPETNVVAAGSLLEFTISKTSFPVGRVNYLFLGPLTFEEFLLNSKNQKLIDILNNHNFDQNLDIAYHNKLNDLLKIYLSIGGMPEALKEYFNTNNYSNIFQIQSEMIISYYNDIPKYSTKKKELEEIETVFYNIPKLIGNQFKYVQISREIKSKNIKDAIYTLQKAGIINLCYSSSGIPLEINKNTNRFKIFFLDVGILQNILNVKPSEWIKNDINYIHNGTIAEQFVSQTLNSLQVRKINNIFFWENLKRGSSAEIDFLIEKNAKIYPVEVKSGASGSLKSLNQYLDKNQNIKMGYKLSINNFEIQKRIQNIPLYAIQSWLRKISN